jgi:hypothetical protein
MKENQESTTHYVTNTLLFIIIMILSTICNRIEAQLWKNENRGLFPNSIGLTVNAKNHSLGIQYGYLFQNPVAQMPLGVYGSYSHTIHPNLWINNYPWEEKYSIGLKITLPHGFRDGLSHTFIEVGPVWNRHPRAWQNDSLLPGQVYADVKSTTDIGFDIGVSMQMKHCLVQIVKVDVMNWFQYAEFGVLYCFSFHKSR